MAGSFQLRLVTPSRQLIDEPVREVSAPGTRGEIGVLPEHITFLGSLEVGVFTYRTDAGAKRIAIKGGFAEMSGDTMIVLADDAVKAEDVNLDKARQDLAKAEAEAQSVSQYDARYPELAAAHRWAQAQIEIARA